MWFSQALLGRASNGLDHTADRLQASPHRNRLMITHLIFLALLLPAHAAAADDALCDKDAKVGAAPAAAACGAGSKTGVPCSCDVRTLRPLQGAVGMEEVRD